MAYNAAQPLQLLLNINVSTSKAIDMPKTTHHVQTLDKIPSLPPRHRASRELRLHRKGGCNPLDGIKLVRPQAALHRSMGPSDPPQPCKDEFGRVRQPQNRAVDVIPGRRSHTTISVFHLRDEKGKYFCQKFRRECNIAKNFKGQTARLTA